MIKVEIPTIFRYIEGLTPNANDFDVYRLYSCRRQLERWCQKNYLPESYHIKINRSEPDKYGAVEARICIEFADEDIATHFKLCYLEKQ
jgi:HEPN domain-containing protein